MFSNSNNISPKPIKGSSLVLGGVMGSRALKSGKFMPAGLIALLRSKLIRFLNYSKISYGCKTAFQNFILAKYTIVW